MNNLELSFLLLSCHHHVIIPILINRSFLFYFCFFLTYLFGRHLQLAGAVGTYFHGNTRTGKLHATTQTTTNAYCKVNRKNQRKENNQRVSIYLRSYLGTTPNVLSHSLTTFFILRITALVDAFR